MSIEDINVKFMGLLLDPLTNKLSVSSLNIGRLFIEYNHPIFPLSWISDTDIPIIILEEENNKDFPLWLNSMGKFISFLKEEGILMGAVKEKEGFLTSLDIQRYGFCIVGYTEAVTLEELRKQENEGLIKIWTPHSFGNEILMNIYSLFNKLENKYIFLNRVNPHILISKNGVEIKEYTTSTNNSMGLNISFKDEGEVLVNGKESHRYCWVYPNEYKTSFIFWITLLSLPIKPTLSQTLGLIFSNTFKGIWKEEINYGVTPQADSIAFAIHCNIIKPLEYQLKEDLFPPFLFKSPGRISPTNNPSSSDILHHFISIKNQPCTPHKYAQYDQYAICGVGAEAMGIGLRVNNDGKKEILSVNIDPKSREGAKLFNRPTSNWKSTTAEGSEDMPLTPSHLKMGTSAGPTRFYGIRLQAAITNSRLGHGSGVASIHPNKKISYKISKRIEGEIPSYLIPPPIKKAIRANGGFGDELLTHLIEPIKKKLRDKVGKVFKPNETILEVWDKYPKYHTHILKAPNLNLEFTLLPIRDENFEIIKYSRSKTGLNIRLDLEATLKDSEVKVRVPGGKFTTIPEDIRFKDKATKWDLFIPYEGIKGRLLMLTSFSNFIFSQYGIESTYVSNEGKLVFDTPINLFNQEVSSIDLTSNDNPFEEWIKENTQLVWVEREINKHILDYLYLDNQDMVQLLGQDKPNADIRVLEDIPNGYKIEEYVQCLMGEIYINVEITSPREYLNVQGLTLEQLVIIETISPELAQALNDKSIGLHQGVKTFIDFSEGKYITKATESLIPKYSPTDFSVYLKDRLKIEKVKREGDILRECEKLLPNGVIIKETKGKGVFIHFGLLCSYGQSGAVIKGLSSSVIHLIRLLIEDSYDEKTIKLWGQKIRIESIQWIQRMQGFKKGNSKIIKRLGRTNHLAVGIKVKTSQLPEVEHRDGLPVFLFHPQCEAIKKLRLKDGDYIGVGRNPMSSLAFGIAVISSYAHIGHIRCSPIVWDRAVAGDSDGDPTFIMNLMNLGIDISEEEMKIWNNSLLMSGNNEFLKDDNFKGFVSPKSKWVDKVIDSTKGIPTYQPNPLDPITTIIPSEDFVDKSEKVANHYAYNVGNGYGIFSLLSFWCANQVALLRKENKDKSIYEINKKINEDPTIVNLQKALILSGRIIYEAKGLGGYSKDRAEVFEVLRALSFQENGNILKVCKDGKWIYASYKDMTKYREEVFSIRDGKKLLTEMLLGEDRDREAINKIVQSNALRLTFSLLEKGKGLPYNNSLIDGIWPSTQQRAAIYGSLRRLGQGSFSEGVNGLSLPQIVVSLGEDVINNFIKSDIIHYYLTQNIPYLARLHNQFKRYR